MTHERVWAAIDAVAARHGLTPSGLARRAGLDATTFNRSKRLGGDGRPRWPSTESIAKILEATGSGFEDFLMLLADSDADRLPPVRTVPFLGFGDAAGSGFFDAAGHPTGTGWDAVSFPGEEDHDLYALELTEGDMPPLYRQGDVILVSPSAQIRRGDRVIIRTSAGAILARVFVRRTARFVETLGLAEPRPPDRIAVSEVAWLARIVWASQ